MNPTIARELTDAERTEECRECGAEPGRPCVEEPQRWDCDCGQGEPAEHEICSFCGDDWGTCDCTERVCEEPHEVRVLDAHWASA